MASKAKNALLEAFLKLIETEAFEKITVTSLVEQCGISRQTFYYHFEDIEQMLTWAFENETQTICNSQVAGKWTDSAKAYIALLNKYDLMIRKGAQSPHFVFIFNLLYNSFYTFIDAYIQKTQSSKTPLNKDHTFLVSCLAASYAGLVVKEIQKPESDYEGLLEKITNAFNVMPN